MRTIIYYYTGTGNSLWVARQLAAQLGEGTELAAIVDLPKNGQIVPEAESIGVAFPVHMWGLPHRVLDWARRIIADPSRYYFAAAVNAGQVARTLVQLKRVLAERGAVLAAGADCVCPSNYIPWGGPGPQAEQEALFVSAQERIRRLAAVVKARKTEPVDCGPLWQRVLFTLLYRWSFPYVPKLDRDFWVDEKCNACGLCAKVCPAGNIVMTSGRPVWQHRCEQCLACIQWCPQEAIQYGRKTPAYERYHHPAVQRSEIMPKRS